MIYTPQQMAIMERSVRLQIKAGRAIYKNRLPDLERMSLQQLYRDGLAGCGDCVVGFQVY